MLRCHANLVVYILWIILQLQRRKYYWKMDLIAYQVTAICASHSENMLAAPPPVIDEVFFYRIAGTYIFDKIKIKAVVRAGDKVTVHMKDGDVVLTVTEE